MSSDTTQPTLNYPAMLKIIASNLYENYDVPDEFISVIENAAEAWNTRPPISQDMNRTEIAKAIYEAKKLNAWDDYVSEYNLPWPKTPKELRTRIYGDDDCGLSFAFAQADAVIKLLGGR